MQERDQVKEGCGGSHKKLARLQMRISEFGVWNMIKARELPPMLKIGGQQSFAPSEGCSNTSLKLHSFTGLG
jgi:hypothetical protein